MELYRQKIEEKIEQSLRSLGESSRLKDACAYALKSGGKRVRPMIVFFVAQSLDKGFDVTDAALAVELFHTASLIADDLPCMDNDDFRRNRPSLHKAFDEATAILATYALIAEGYERIRLASIGHSAEICQLALKAATANTGIHGATGGQYLDLFAPDDIERVITKKTSTLFEISFVFGWLFGGGEIALLEKVKRAAYYYGLAFQLQDDLLDVKQDGQMKNYAHLYGREKTEEAQCEAQQRLVELLCELDIDVKLFTTALMKEHSSHSLQAELPA